MKVVNTICPYCGVGCGLELKVERNQIVECKGTLESPVNLGRLCIKGLYAHEFVSSTERLKKPFVNGKHSSWRNAMSLIAAELRKRRKENPDLIGFLVGAKCTNEENYIFQKFTRFLGTNNIDSCTRLCQAPAGLALGEIFGLSAMYCSIAELEQSKCIMLFGSNMLENHSVLGNRLLKAKESGAKIIVIDPRRTITGGFADIYVPINPATDIAFVNSLINEIIKRKLYDKNSVSKISRFKELKEIVSKYEASKVAKLCGISSGVIKEVAELYAKSEKSAILTCMGLTQQSHGSENITACSNLAILAGQYGRAGTGVNPLRGQNNVQGVGDMGCLPSKFPGYRAVNEENAKKLSEMWGFKVPDKTGLNMIEMFEKEMKFLYVVGENPFITHPNQKHVVEFLNSLNFLVVQDIFPNAMMEYADVVLPAACFAEKEGTFTNTERRVQRVRKAVSPPWGVRTDFEIFAELAGMLGLKLEATPEGIFSEIRKAVPQYAGIDYSELGIQGKIWKAELKKDLKFYPVEHRNPFEEKDERYPFVLITGRAGPHYHTDSMTSRCDSLRKTFRDCYVEINIEDAAKLNIRSGEWVKVITKTGSITTRANITKNIKSSVIFVPFHYAKSAANKLVKLEGRDLAGTPVSKFNYARVEKI